MLVPGLHDREAAAADARSAVVLAPWLPRVRHHQLFFAGMDRRRAAPRALPRRYGQKGRPLKPPPPAVARPGTGGTQLALFAAAPARDYRQVRFDLRRGSAPANPWLGWALYLARLAGEARGWQPVTRRGMQRVLVTLLSGHRDGEVIAASAVRAVAGRHSISSHNVIRSWPRWKSWPRTARTCSPAGWMPSSPAWLRPCPRDAPLGHHPA